MSTEIRQVDVERFWSKVAFKVGGCWLWQSGTDKDGYGKFQIGPSGRQHHFLAHRFAYLITHGPLPANDVIRHACDAAACVNPTHLTAGSQAENIQDMVERGRQARGEQDGNSKLTNEEVQEIRRRRALGETNSQLAYDFHVAVTTVWGIVSRRTWRHLP